MGIRCSRVWGGRPSAPAPFSGMTGASAAIHVAWSLPLLKFQCPLSRKPPGVGTDLDPRPVARWLQPRAVRAKSLAPWPSACAWSGSKRHYSGSGTRQRWRRLPQTSPECSGNQDGPTRPRPTPEATAAGRTRRRPCPPPVREASDVRRRSSRRTSSTRATNGRGRVQVVGDIGGCRGGGHLRSQWAGPAVSCLRYTGGEYGVKGSSYAPGSGLASSMITAPPSQAPMVIQLFRNNSMPSNGWSTDSRTSTQWNSPCHIMRVL